MVIMKISPEPINEVPALIAQVEGCSGDGCRNARPRAVSQIGSYARRVQPNLKFARLRHSNLRRLPHAYNHRSDD